MVFNPDFSLQLAHQRQAELRGERIAATSSQLRRPGARRRRVGAWIVRFGLAVSGASARRPALQP